MANIVKNTDFKDGKFKIGSDKYDIASIDKYIARYEPIYLAKLLGVETYKLFKIAIDASLPAAPAAPFDVIYGEILEDDRSCEPCFNYGYYNYLYLNPSGCIRQSLGIKDMLIGFIYFEIQRDFYTKQTPAGGAKNSIENAKLADPSYMYNMYNEAVDSYVTIQWHIYENKDTVTEFEGFNGQPIDKSWGY